jgi:uncharacterized protein YicC (UPF0701 family)
MSRVDAAGRVRKFIELKSEAGTTAQEAMQQRLVRLERLASDIEDELADLVLSDEQKLQNIGERVAGVTDGT